MFCSLSKMVVSTKSWNASEMMCHCWGDEKLMDVFVFQLYKHVVQIVEKFIKKVKS